MLAKELLSGAILVSCCLLSAATQQGGGPQSPGPEASRLAVKDLEISFHEATTCGDYDKLARLWAEDAVVSTAAGTFVGPVEIADFFSSGPLWGRVTSLSSNYKALSAIHGNTADFAFECILVDVADEDPLTAVLSSLGCQNPKVEIVQHSNATCTAVRNGNRWVFQSFTGAAGPIMP